MLTYVLMAVLLSWYRDVQSFVRNQSIGHWRLDGIMLCLGVGCIDVATAEIIQFVARDPYSNVKHLIIAIGQGSAFQLVPISCCF